MRFEQFRIVLLLAAMLMAGCGAFVNKDLPVVISLTSAERNFAAALQYIRIGNESKARESLENVVDESSLAGITDEALFRLAILNLRDENGKGETRARKLLERLSTSYPSSIWTHQAAPLLGYLQEIASLRARTRELKGLRNQNLSLSRDNKELRQNLERLKDLDLELEQKIRR